MRYSLPILQLLAATTAKAAGNTLPNTLASLRPLLSPSAEIIYNGSSRPRWSDYHAPNPGATVIVAAEQDVVETIKFCHQKAIPFLAQNGGSGWASPLDLDSTGIVVDLQRLDQVTFNAERTEATIGGGTLISQAIDAAYKNDAQIVTGNCNCVGTLGALLGGGYGNLMGLAGFGVDLVLSLNYVDPKGELIVVDSSTAESNDLWWALRGAAPNFGIVTSAVVRSRAVPQAESKAWLGGLAYTPDKLERVVAAINDLKLEAEMNIFLYFLVSNSTPVIFVTPFYYGPESTAREKFASILDIGPVSDTTGIVAYTHWNDGADGFCVRGGRKPAYASGMLHLKPDTWRRVWNEFANFTTNPGTQNSILLMEAYSLDKAHTFDDSSSSFANRYVRFNAAVIPWYSDNSLDATAQEFGQRVRDIWWSSSDLPSNVSYINFAHGDEELQAVYGGNLERLQNVKSRYDPDNVFHHWFPLVGKGNASLRRA